MEKKVKNDEEWKKQLTPEQFRICRTKGTERAFSGEYNHCKEEGVYQCVCCGNDLFISDAKFNSGTGWPSFFKPISQEHVRTESDHSYGMQRVEVLCGQCDSHLGHLFDDGPPPTGQRYCINSVSIKLAQKY